MFCPPAINLLQRISANAISSANKESDIAKEAIQIRGSDRATAKAAQAAMNDDVSCRRRYWPTIITVMAKTAALTGVATS